MSNLKAFQIKKGRSTPMKTYEQFLLDLAKSESSSKYDIVNKFGFLGKYQMGKAALVDAGYYRKDGRDNNTFSDSFWTDKDNVKSKSDFLNMPQAQENAIREYMKTQWKYLLHANVDRYIGQTRYGILITTSGSLAGAHLVGWSKVALFVKKGINAPDGSNPPVHVIDYLTRFSGYDMPFKPRQKLTASKKDEQGNTIMYQVDGKEWVTKEIAIAMVKNEELDGVLVTNKNGTLFLKTPPDKTIENNLG